MAFLCTGSPVTAFADAFKSALDADATLDTLVTGVFGSLSEAGATAYPYVVLGRTTDDGAGGAMSISGGRVEMQIDVWSRYKGPYQTEQILSRIKALMERRPHFRVDGFAPLDGSLHCEMSEVFDEPDEDKPDARLWHGVQRWTCEIHEA